MAAPRRPRSRGFLHGYSGLRSGAGTMADASANNKTADTQTEFLASEKGAACVAASLSLSFSRSTTYLGLVPGAILG